MYKYKSATNTFDGVPDYIGFWLILNCTNENILQTIKSNCFAIINRLAHIYRDGDVRRYILVLVIGSLYLVAKNENNDVSVARVRNIGQTELLVAPKILHTVCIAVVLSVNTYNVIIYIWHELNVFKTRNYFNTPLDWRHGIEMNFEIQRSSQC